MTGLDLLDLAFFFVSVRKASTVLKIILTAL